MSTNVTADALGVLFDGVAFAERQAREADKALQDGKRRATYGRAANGWRVILEAMSPARHEELVKEIIRRQVPLPMTGQNKYLPLVRCMWGKFDWSAPRVSHLGTTNLVVWKPDRSFEKYAAVYLWAETMGYTPDNLADKLEQFKHEKHGRGISGVVAYMSELHGERRNVADKPTVFKAPKGLEENGSYVVILDVQDGKATYRCPAPISKDDRTRILKLAPKSGVEVDAEAVSKGVMQTKEVWMTMPAKQIAPKAIGVQTA